MPKVQTVSAPTVQNRGFNASLNTRASAQSFGGGIGSAIQQVAGQAAQIAAREKQEDDQAVIKEATNQYRQFVNQRTYLDEDGYYNRKGKQAYESYDSLTGELEQARKRIAENLQPGSQQDMFNSFASDYLINEQESMSRHAATERTNWFNEQDTSLIQQAQQDGSLRWINNGVYSQQISSAINNLASRNGWTPEKKEVEKQRYLTAMHSAAIDNILQDSPSAADDYFEAHKDDISPTMHDEIKATIKRQGDAQWTVDNADQILLEGGSRSEQLARARALTEDDPDRRKLLTAQVEHNYNQQKIAKEESQLAIYDDAAKGVIAGGSLTEYMQRNPDNWARMSAAQQQQLIKLSRNPSGVSQSDLPTYYQIRGLISQGDTGSARTMLLNSMSKLSHPDFKKFADELGKLSGGGRGGSEKDLNVRTSLAHFNDGVEPLIGREPKDGSDRKDWNRRRNILMGIYQEDIDDYMRTNNRTTIPESERQKILDRMMIKMNKEDGGFLWFDKDVSIDDIPIEDLEGIKGALESQNIPVTPENILKLYTYQGE